MVHEIYYGTMAMYENEIYMLQSIFGDEFFQNDFHLESRLHSRFSLVPHSADRRELAARHSVWPALKFATNMEK